MTRTHRGATLPPGTSRIQGVVKDETHFKIRAYAMKHHITTGEALDQIAADINVNGAIERKKPTKARTRKAATFEAS